MQVPSFDIRCPTIFGQSPWLRVTIAFVRTDCGTEGYFQRNESILFASVSNFDIIFVLLLDRL